MTTAWAGPGRSFENAESVELIPLWYGGSARGRRLVLRNGFSKEHPALSARAAIIAIVACALLGAAVWWAKARPASVVPPPAPSWTFDAGVVRSLTVESDGAAARHLERSLVGASGPWVARGTTSWPVEAVRVRAALNLIGQLVREPNSETSGFAPRAIVTVHDALGNSLSIELAAEVVGGRIFARVRSPDDPEPVGRIATGEFARVFTPAGIDAWRASSVFTALADEPTRIGLQSAAHSATIRRNQGRWGLELSPPVPAEAARVKETIAQLASLTIERFVTPDDPMAESLVRPAAMITVESDFRPEPDGPRRTIVQTLRIGNVADAASRTVIADLVATLADSGETLWGPQPFTLRAEAVAAIKSDPAWLASRIPVQAPAADIGMIRMYRASDADTPLAMEWTRTLDGWAAHGESGAAVDSRLSGTAALLIDMLKKPSAGVRFAAPTDAALVARVTLHSAGGTLLETVGIYRGGVGGPAYFARTGETWRAVDAPVDLADTLGTAR